MISRSCTVSALEGSDQNARMNFMNLRIVLVRPQYSGNIGAVARAMRNFSVSDLALVNPAPVHRAQADMMAVHARDVLDRMQIHTSVQAAIADCGLVIGTTCRSGIVSRGYRHTSHLSSAYPAPRQPRTAWRSYLVAKTVDYQTMNFAIVTA